MEYVKIIADNPIARKVKMADLKHNMDNRRTGGQFPRKIELYKEAYHYLESYMPKKYPQFGQIIDTMKKENYDYKKDWVIVKDSYTMNEHIGGIVYAQLSNQRPWKPIAEHFKDIDAIFHGFDPEYLKTVEPTELEAEIRAIHCGNRQIHKQMLFLKENVETLERIGKENGSIDAYLRNTNSEDLVHSLSCGKYKLKQMGVALVSEYLKNKGVELVKPDVHVCRILGRLGFTEHSPATEEEAFDVCREIAAEYGMRVSEVDSVLWQFGAEGYFELCTSTPKCENCQVLNCSERK